MPSALVVELAFSFDDVSIQNSSLLLNLSEQDFEEMCDEGYFHEVASEVARLMKIGCWSGMSSVMNELENAVLAFYRDKTIDSDLEEEAELQNMIEDAESRYGEMMEDLMRGK